MMEDESRAARGGVENEGRDGLQEEAWGKVRGDVWREQERVMGERLMTGDGAWGADGALIKARGRRDRAHDVNHFQAWSYPSLTARLAYRGRGSTRSPWEAVVATGPADGWTTSCHWTATLIAGVSVGDLHPVVIATACCSQSTEPEAAWLAACIPHGDAEPRSPLPYPAERRPAPRERQVDSQQPQHYTA